MTVDVYPAIVGVGEALPERVVTNQELIDETGIQSTPEWIESRTGIRERRWAADGQLASDLAVVAARGALAQSGVGLDKIGAIYLGTTTPDYISPSTASLVHGRLGAQEECLSVDLRAACAAGVIGLESAMHRTMAEEGDAGSLVIGANILSRTVDKQNRSTVVLFGDGAGAAVVSRVAGAQKPYSMMFTQPNRDAIYIPGGGMEEPSRGPNDPRCTIHMDGPVVKRHAVDLMSRTAMGVARKAGIYDPTEGIDWGQIDFLIPHQANMRLIEAVGDELNVPAEKCVITVDKHGNTSSASGFLALSEAYNRGEVPSGTSRVLFTAIGAGFVGGSVLTDVVLP